jgi:hypothetical protein
MRLEASHRKNELLRIGDHRGGGGKRVRLGGCDGFVHGRSPVLGLRRGTRRAFARRPEELSSFLGFRRPASLIPINTFRIAG